MAVRIRLMRTGRRNRAFYRICAFDARTARGGKALEILGHYDPLSPREEEQVVLKKERIAYWLSQGAQPSETVRSFCKRFGVELPARTKARKPRKRGVQRKKKVQAKQERQKKKAAAK